MHSDKISILIIFLIPVEMPSSYERARKQRDCNDQVVLLLYVHQLTSPWLPQLGSINPLQMGRIRLAYDRSRPTCCNELLVDLAVTNVPQLIQFGLQLNLRQDFE